MGFWFGDNTRLVVGVGEGVVLIREWPLVGGIVRRPNWLSGGLHPTGTPPHPVSFHPLPS